jgi:tetratricopeptide (TPR) repeat protein
MADHIISPDGKFMWTGSEWIPIPQRPSEDSAFVSLQDSVIAGDLSITQNEPEHLGIAIGAMLKELGFNSQGEPSELKTEHKQEIDRMLIITENAEEQGIEFDPDTEMLVGSGALSDGRTHIAERHFKKALKAYREKKERLGESNSLYKLGIIAKKRGNFDESEQLFRNSLYIKVEVGDRIGEIAVLSSLVDIAEEKEEPGDLKKLHRDIIDIAREIGDWGAVSHHLGSLISLAEKHNDDDETEVLLKEGLVIDRKHGRKSHELWNLRDLTILVVKKGNLDEAENIARELINLDIKFYGHSGLLCNDYDVLIDIVKKRGNIDEAISLIRKKIAISKKRGEPEFMPHMGARDLEKILRLTEKRGNLDEVKRLKKEISLTRKK